MLNPSALTSRTRTLSARLPLRPSLIQLQNAVIEASHAAGKALLRRFRTPLKVTEKPGAGLVTNADFEAERAAIKVLKAAFPDFGILAEESAPKLSQGLGRWVIDPLDGTTNFAHGLTTFCVSIAAEWGGEIVAAAIFHPVAGDTYTAIQGKGAFVNGKRMKVSATRDLRNSFLSTGFSSRKDRWLAQEIETFERLSRKVNGIRRPGSAALDLAHVARGVFDGFWERGLAPWDVAAGSLLIEEAGGKVTGFNGKSLDMNSGEIICSNGLIHRALIRESGLGAPSCS